MNFYEFDKQISKELKKDEIMEKRFTNIEILAEILANSMECYDEDEFYKTAEDLGVNNPEELYEKYWNIPPLERDNANFDFEEWITENAEFQ